MANFSVKSSDLEKYIKYIKYIKSEDQGEPHPITNWMYLQSQIHLDGLSALNTALNQEKPLSIGEIKKQCAEGLLRDLETVSKREDTHNQVRDVLLPEFKEDFYNQLTKDPKERSDEYKEFINACSEKLTAVGHFTEMISASALIKLDEPNVELDNLKQHFQTSITNYKNEHQRQVNKDSERRLIFYKGEEGIAKKISHEELRDSNAINLTGEQRDFLLTSWQQGSFAGGWITTQASASYKAENNELYHLAHNDDRQTPIFIDASSQKVKVYNRTENDFTIEGMGSEEESEIQNSGLEASVTVDITDLKGDKFIPGCSTNKPEIIFNIEELNEDIKLKVPEDLQLSDHDANISKEIKAAVNEAKPQAIIDFIQDLSKNPRDEVALSSLKGLVLPETSLAHIPPVTSDSPIDQDKTQPIQEAISQIYRNPGTKQEPDQYARAAELFSKFNVGDEAKKDFAAQKLDEYLTAQITKNPNNKELASIEKGMTSILSHACKSDQEKQDMKKFTSKVMRDYLSENNQKMSFSQKWEQFKETTSNWKSMITGKENKMQATMLTEEHQKLAEKIKDNLQKNNTKSTGHAHSVRSHSKDSFKTIER